jgi:hypothetical protein
LHRFEPNFTATVENDREKSMSSAVIFRRQKQAKNLRKSLKMDPKTPKSEPESAALSGLKSA